VKRLGDIQQELKAHKGQRNTFGNYDYRSCEDILEAVKPLLMKSKLIMTLDDEMIEIGGRVYVKATARLYDDKNALITEVTANACESESKKGMDSAQITGAASSYARKYALNGLFLIDDTKDADTQDNSSTPPPATTSSTSKPASSGCISEAQGKRLFAICKGSGTTIADCANKFGFKKAGEIKKSQYKEVCEWAESGQKAEMVQEVFDESQPNPDDIPF
jgi:hypothetical protein